MKKIVSVILILVLVFLLFPVKTNAEQTSSQKTEQRFLLEFEELAMMRLVELKQERKEEYGTEFEITINPLGYCREYSDAYELNSTFGLISTSKEDFNVTNIIMTLIIEKQDDEKNEINKLKCISAMSALEYDQQEESMIAIEHQFGLSNTSSALEKTEEIWEEIITPGLERAFYFGSHSKMYSVLVYSGNYDYYISSLKTENGINYSLIAKSK